VWGPAEATEIIVGESPIPGPLAGNLNDPEDADVAYKNLGMSTHAAGLKIPTIGHLPMRTMDTTRTPIPASRPSAGPAKLPSGKIVALIERSPKTRLNDPCSKTEEGTARFPHPVKFR